MRRIADRARLRVSKSALAGMNNKAEVVGHRAHGYRRAEACITAIWHGRGIRSLKGSHL